MPRLVGTELPIDRTIAEALEEEIAGLRPRVVAKILRETGIKGNKLVEDLTKRELDVLEKAIPRPIARCRFSRISARKVGQVLDLIKNKGVAEALSLLSFTPKKAAVVVKKVVQSAMANAMETYGMEVDRLYVFRATADQGPTLQRWRALSMGRASRIRKRTCHVTVVLKEREEE
jgi:large subunit ribosomal protein L22